jgi:hypothetical protein
MQFEKCEKYIFHLFSLQDITQNESELKNEKYIFNEVKR